MSSELTIVERVKKLLRLARDKAAAQAEAAQALNRALELIRQHEIDVAALDLDEPTERLVCERVHVGWSISFIKRRVNTILLTYFKVRTIWDRPNLAIVGFESDVTIAGYVFHFLVRACSEALKEYVQGERKARRKVTTRKKQGFIQGWIYGVASNLIQPDQPRSEIDDSNTALVLAAKQKAVERHFADLFPNAVHSKPPKASLNKTSLWSGYLRGKETTITTPLEGTSAEPLLLS
jgi:hypothetical protein